MGIQVTGRFILASASKRRIELLQLLGLEFETRPSSISESMVAGEPPKIHVRRLSAEKAGELAVSHPDAWVLGADTIVCIKGEMLGKPATTEDAKSMLVKLKGRQHQVHTGFTIACQARNILMGDTVTSSVTFKDISEEEINWYIHTEEPYDKAGGYALQGRGAMFVRDIHGSYTNVIGLPLCEVINMLIRLEALAFTAF